MPEDRDNMMYMTNNSLWVRMCFGKNLLRIRFKAISTRILNTTLKKRDMVTGWPEYLITSISITQ